MIVVAADLPKPPKLVVKKTVDLQGREEEDEEEEGGGGPRCPQKWRTADQLKGDISTDPIGHHCQTISKPVFPLVNDRSISLRFLHQ